jgi:hypothetical protein
MKLPVILEPTSKGTFRARSGEPLAIAAEGETEAEALQNYRNAALARLSDGPKLVAVEIPGGPHESEHSWLAFAGTLPDDDLTREWMEEMRRYRRQKDEEDGIFS